MKRSATVTETFDAVTPRMLKATEARGRAGNWCRWLRWLALRSRLLQR